MKFADLQFAPTPRSDVVKLAKTLGASASETELVADLATHAADRAMEAMLAVVDLNENVIIQIRVTGLADMLLRARLKALEARCVGAVLAVIGETVAGSKSGSGPNG